LRGFRNGKSVGIRQPASRNRIGAATWAKNALSVELSRPSARCLTGSSRKALWAGSSSLKQPMPGCAQKNGPTYPVAQARFSRTSRRRGSEADSVSCLHWSDGREFLHKRVPTEPASLCQILQLLCLVSGIRIECHRPHHANVNPALYLTPTIEQSRLACIILQFRDIHGR
jgi:hypothetical protein